MDGLVRSSVLTGYRDLVSDLSGNPDTLLNNHHIAPQSLERRESLISYRSFMRLMESTADGLDCPNFGLALARRQGLSILGPVALAGMNSGSVGEALATMLRYLHFFSNSLVSTLDTRTDPQHPMITFDVHVSGESRRRQTVELGVGVIFEEMRALCGRQFRPERVLFSHTSPLPVSLYREHFDAPVLFGQDVNALVIRAEHLECPLHNADADLRRNVMDYIEQQMEHRPLDMKTQVVVLVRSLLATEQSSLSTVAHRLGLHERTLQRRLCAQGLVFEDIVDEVRRERCWELLKSSCLNMSQIADRLGYQEASSFNRACRRWFGESPSRLRRLPGDQRLQPA